jgi:tRNA uracil 4-sulfurtransferase
MERVLVLHYHEIWLKGGNRNFFLSRLVAAVKHSLGDFAIQSLRHVAERLLLIPGDERAIPAMLERLGRVFGLAYIAPARRVSSELTELAPAACEMMAEKDPRNFAVRAKIADSTYGINSMELEREVGREILNYLRGQGRNVQVKLNEPQVTCWVEVIPGTALLYADRVEGAGGLPPGTGGRLVSLLSGGFDSAVAAYKAMRRGVHVTFVHFFGTPSPSRGSSKPVAIELVKALTPYQFSSRLYLVPFDSIQRQIVARADERFRVLLYRRMMARIAREVARAERALGLVTGDSISQVASQTLHNLAALDRGLDLPVYRPLAGDDKHDIMRVARKIGTYKISCEPFEDCCPRFMPRSPAIFSSPEELDRAEVALDVESMVTAGLAGVSVLDFKFERGEILYREGVPRRFQKLLDWHKGTSGAVAPQAKAPAPS